MKHHGKFVKVAVVVALATTLLVSCTEIPREGSEPPLVPDDITESVLAWGREATEPDQLVPGPGGFYYAASIHMYLKPDKWAPIEIIQHDFDTIINPIRVEYRAIINTKANQIRVNNIYVAAKPLGLGPFQHFREIHDLTITVSEVPDDIKIWCSPESGSNWGTLNRYLYIKIPENTKAGDYSFKIGIELDGHFYGKIPCTVRVSE